MAQPPERAARGWAIPAVAPISPEVHTADLSLAHTASLEWIREPRPRPPSAASLSQVVSSALTTLSRTHTTASAATHSTAAAAHATRTTSHASSSHPYPHPYRLHGHPRRPTLGLGMGKTSSPAPKVVLKRNRSRSASAAASTGAGGSEGKGMGMGIGSGLGLQGVLGGKHGRDGEREGDVIESDTTSERESKSSIGSPRSAVISPGLSIESGGPMELDVVPGKVWTEPASAAVRASTPVHLQPRKIQARGARPLMPGMPGLSESDGDYPTIATRRWHEPSPPLRFGAAPPLLDPVLAVRYHHRRHDSDSSNDGGRERDDPSARSTLVRDLLVSLNDASASESEHGVEHATGTAPATSESGATSASATLFKPATRRTTTRARCRLPPLIVSQVQANPRTPEPVQHSDDTASAFTAGPPARKRFLPRGSSPSFRPANKLATHGAAPQHTNESERHTSAGQDLGGGIGHGQTTSLASHLATAGASRTHDASSDPLGWGTEGSTAARARVPVLRSSSASARGAWDESTDPLILRPSGAGISSNWMGRGGMSKASGSMVAHRGSRAERTTGRGHESAVAEKRHVASDRTVGGEAHAEDRPEPCQEQEQEQGSIEGFRSRHPGLAAENTFAMDFCPGMDDGSTEHDPFRAAVSFTDESVVMAFTPLGTPRGHSDRPPTRHRSERIDQHAPAETPPHTPMQQSARSLSSDGTASATASATTAATVDSTFATAYRTPTPPIRTSDYPSIAFPLRKTRRTLAQRGSSTGGQRSEGPGGTENGRQTKAEAESESKSDIEMIETEQSEDGARGGRRKKRGPPCRLRGTRLPSSFSPAPPDPARAARIAFFAELDAHYALDVELVVLGGLERGYNLLRAVSGG